MATRHPEYRGYCRKKVIFTIGFMVAVVFLSIFSLKVGFYETTYSEIFDVIWKNLNGMEVPRQDQVIIWESRVPEAIVAILTGAALSVGGAVMQTVLRNPLADSYTMGISSGAFFGVTIAAIAGVSLIPGIGSDLATIINAFVFSLIPVAIVLMISRNRKMTPTKIILVGIAIMYVFSAVSTLLMLTADSETLADVYSWRVGTLSNIAWNHVGVILVFVVAGIAYLMFNNRKYNLMMAGDNCAQSMGIDTKRTTLTSMTVISLITAAVVSFTGTIGFVGLVGPHIARIFVGSESKYLIPASAAFGAAFLLIADCISRVSGTYGLPVGVISAIIGCPLFVIILVKMRSKEWA